MVRGRVASRWKCKTSLVLIFFAVSLSVVGCGGGGGDSSGNSTPTAYAGADRDVDELTMATLDGSQSSDNDGTITSYVWSQIAGPLVTLNNSNSAIASYTAPMANSSIVLRFRLTVTDSDGASDNDEVTHTVNSVNMLPVPDAGADQFAPEQTLVNLDGSQSSDSDGTIVSYGWTQLQGTPVTLNNGDTESPTFTTPAATEVLIFELAVTDNEGATGSDEVVVSVSEVLFSDNFNSGDLNGWTDNVIDDSGAASGWGVIGGEYFQQNNVESVPLNESYNQGTYSYPNAGAGWSNYRLSVEVTPLIANGNLSQGTDAGVMFRYQDNNNYYRLSLNSKYGFTRLEKKVAGIFSTLTVDSAGYNVEETLNIIIEANGSTIQVFVNDDPLFSVIDSDISTGTIALYCQGRVKFDNVLDTKNSLAPSVVLSSPIAYSIETTGDSLDPNKVEVTATVNNAAGGSVEFVLDDSESIESNSLPFPNGQFPNVLQGNHRVEAILFDASGVEQYRDTNYVIGVQGDYYIAVGDSITNGDGDNYSSDNISQDGRILAIQGYEANLNDLLTSTLSYPHVVFNEGIPGDKTADALGRISSILKRHPRSNRALIMLGTNDALAAISTPQYRSNIQALVDAVVPEKTAWVALLPPVFKDDGTGTLHETRNPRIQDYNNVITSQLTDIQVGPDFYDFFIGSGVNRYSLFADDLHPNSLGHAMMAYLWHNSLNYSNPLQLPLILENLSNTTATPLSYKQNLLEVGDKYYVDEPFTITNLPTLLEGDIWVMTANGDRFNTSADFLSFEVDRNVIVYVAYDATALIPGWLSTFTDSGLQVSTTNGSFKLYSREYDGTSPITLGGNRAGGGTGSSNYLVIVKEN